MAESNDNGGRVNTEYVLGSLDDDSDSDMDDEIEGVKKPVDYETQTLKEINDLVDEVEKTSDKIDDTHDKILFDKYSEYILQIIIQLDNIDTRNIRRIREARKDAILYAQACLQKLDKKMYGWTNLNKNIFLINCREFVCVKYNSNLQ